MFAIFYLNQELSKKIGFKAINILDSIADMVRNDKIKFKEAAFYYSDDKDTKQNGGLVVNPKQFEFKIH